MAIFPRFHADSGGFCRRISHGSLLEPDECVLHLLARLPLAILSALANVNVTNGGQKRTSKAATWPSVTPPSSIPEIPRGMSWRFRRLSTLPPSSSLYLKIVPPPWRIRSLEILENVFACLYCASIVKKREGRRIIQILLKYFGYLAWKIWKMRPIWLDQDFSEYIFSEYILIVYRY